jgi:hypothetical protein
MWRVKQLGQDIIVPVDQDPTADAVSLSSCFSFLAMIPTIRPLVELIYSMYDITVKNNNERHELLFSREQETMEAAQETKLGN